MDDEVPVDELRQVVEQLHGVPATFVEIAEVDETFDGGVVWRGTVHVFALSDHPSGAKLAYAWSRRTDATRRKFKAILGVPPVHSAVMAVQTSIVEDQKKKQN